MVLAGARNTGYANKFAERYFGINIFQIVLACADYLETFAVALSALCGNGNFLAAAKILPGYRLLAVHYILGRTRADYLSAVYTRSRADIDDIIRRAHCVLVVLNDY